MANIIDLSYLNEISGGDNSFIKEMLELFVNTTAIEADQYASLLSEGNYEGIGHLAHKMKAPIQMLGANDLFNILRSLEKFGKEGQNLDQMPGMISDVKKQIDICIEEVKEILTTL
jgi:HPt (histidine-containing phosphotransfer) domain-containing protein